MASPDTASVTFSPSAAGGASQTAADNSIDLAAEFNPPEKIDLAAEFAAPDPDKEKEKREQLAGMVSDYLGMVVPGIPSVAWKAILTKGGTTGDVAASVIPPLAGSIVGSVGGPAGTAVGGGIGGAAGATLTEARQYFRGDRDELTAGPIVTGTLLGAIPLPGKVAPTALFRGGKLVAAIPQAIAVRGAQGAILGAGAEGIGELIDTGKVDIPTLAKSAAWGALFGAGAGAFEAGALTLAQKDVLNRIRKVTGVDARYMSDEQLIQKMRDIRAGKANNLGRSAAAGAGPEVIQPKVPQLADEFSPPATEPRAGTQQVEIPSKPIDLAPSEPIAPLSSEPPVISPESAQIAPNAKEPMIAAPSRIPVTEWGQSPTPEVKQAAENVVETIKPMDADQFMAWSKLQNESGGITAKAIEIGRAAQDSPEMIQQFQELRDQYYADVDKAIQNGDFDSASIMGAKGQLFSEAYQYATNTGIAQTPMEGESAAQQQTPVQSQSAIADVEPSVVEQRQADDGGRPNEATLHLQPQEGLQGKVSAPQVIEAFAGILKAAELNPKSIRFGRMGAKRARGFYRPFDQIIRIRTANNINTAAHEVAHAIEDKLWGLGHVWEQDKLTTPQSRSELKELGRDLYGSKKPAAGYESEGFAEFLRLYLTDPAKAQELAPAFSRQWQEKILPENPQLDEAIGVAQQAGTTWQRQGSMTRVEKSIAPAPTAREKITEAVKNQLTSFRRHWIDSAAPIHDLVEEAKAIKPVAPTDDPMSVLVANRMTADAKVHFMATEGMLDWAGNVVGPPLQDAFALVPLRQTNNFVIYLYAKRALALWDDPRGSRNPGIARADAEEVIKQLQSPRFDLAAQIVYDWNDAVLSYAAEASPDFAETVNKIRAADPGFYLPLFREFDALDKRYGSGVGMKGKALVKHLGGSGRRIKDPIGSMIAQAKAIVLKAQQKAVLDRIVQIAKSTPSLGHLVTKVPVDRLPAFSRKIEGIDVSFAAAIDRLRQEGVPITLDDDIVTFFSPAYTPKQNEVPVIPIFSNGKREWYEMDPELYAALSGMDVYRMGPALDLMFGTFTRSLRMGTTGYRAAFSLVTNPLRDLRTLHVNSQASARSAQLFGYWMHSLVEGAVDIISGGKIESEWLNLAKRLGVSMAGSLTQDTKHLKIAVRKVKRGGRWDPLDMRSHIDFLREILQIPESASRVAEMRAIAKDIGWDPSMPLTPEIAQKLAIGGKQVTTDFTQSGDYAKVANQAIPFFTAGIAGPTAHARALRNNPRKFILRALQGTVAALVLWWYNKDKEWWKEMSTKERYLFTYIPVGDELIRIPRSYEVDGIFMAGAEALADAWYRSDPKQATEWFSQFVQQSSQFEVVNGLPVPPLPPTLKLAFEEASNRNFYFNTPIVPRGQAENLPPSEQYNEFSTNVSIGLGKMFNISPRRIDHAIRGIFGPVGGDITSLFGRGGEKQATERQKEISDIPVLGILSQRGGQRARNPVSIDRLYDLADLANRNRGLKGAIGETPNERQIRLMLNDAVRTQTALNEMAKLVGGRERRQELEAMRIAVARTAIRMAESKQVDRSITQSLLRQYTSELRSLKSEAP